MSDLVAVHGLPPDTDLAAVSYAEFIRAKWAELCTGLDIGPALWAPVADYLGELLSGWGSRPLGAAPCYRSYVSASGLPFELAVNWSAAGPQLRVLWESLGDPGSTPTPRKCQDAGAALTRQLAGRAGVSVDRYLAIEDLFLAEDPCPDTFTVWHGLSWRPGQEPRLRVYLNARGPICVGDRTAEAMDRIDLASAWQPVGKRYRELADRGHDLCGIGLDLEAAPDARVKVYFVNAGADAEQVDRLAAMSRAHSSEILLSTYRALVGDEGPSRGGPPSTCLTFQAGHDGPTSSNVYLPLAGNTDSDEHAMEVLGRIMYGRGLDTAGYARSVTALLARERRQDTRLQEFVSCRTDIGRFDMTVYLRFAPWVTTPEEGSPGS